MYFRLQFNVIIGSVSCLNETRATRFIRCKWRISRERRCMPRDAREGWEGKDRQARFARTLRKRSAGTNS